MQTGARVWRPRWRLRGRAEQLREGKSPIPAAGGPQHVMVPIQAAPPPLVTAGVSFPPLPSCPLIPQPWACPWSSSWSGWYLARRPHQPCLPLVPAAPPFLTSQLPPLCIYYFFTPMQLTPNTLIQH